MMGVALILALRFHRYTARALLALFAVQFPSAPQPGGSSCPASTPHWPMAGLILDRRHLIATLQAPFIATAIRDSVGRAPGRGRRSEALTAARGRK